MHGSVAHANDVQTTKSTLITRLMEAGAAPVGKMHGSEPSLGRRLTLGVSACHRVSTFQAAGRLVDRQVVQALVLCRLPFQKKAPAPSPVQLLPVLSRVTSASVVCSRVLVPVSYALRQTISAFILVTCPTVGSSSTKLAPEQTLQTETRWLKN